MSKLATTKMSSKGQIVIPEEIRVRLDLKTGEQFVVVGEDDVVILKKIVHPSMADFDKLINRARRQAKKAGMEPSDILAAVRTARGRR